MRDVPYRFDQQWQAGEDGVGVLLRSFPSVAWKKTDGRKGDILDENGVKYEVKTDYKFVETGNLFIEKISIEETGAVGGPWQAREHGCFGMIFVCPKRTNSVIYFYLVEKLIQVVERLMTKGYFPLKHVLNEHHMTRGYAIPPEDLKEACYLETEGAVL